MEKSFEKWLKRCINESISHVIKEDTWTDWAKYDAFNTTVDQYNNSEPDSDLRKHMDRVGNHIGVNMNGKTNAVHPDEFDNREIFLKRLTTAILNVSEQLRTYMGSHGNMKREVLFAPDIDNHLSGVTPDDLGEEHLQNSAYLMKMKDLIDKLNLTFLYDPTKTVKKTASELYGIVLDEIRDAISNDSRKGRHINPDKLEQYFNAIQKLDLTKVSDKEILSWSTEGVRGKVSNKNNVFNQFPMYDENGEQLVGAQWKEAISKDTEQMDKLRAMQLESIVRSYMQHVYGLEFAMPGAPFIYGNAKLPSSSLIINFTSAHGCPSWNACLLKHACYARTSEHGYQDLWAKNDRLQMMWEGSRYDDKIKQAMHNMVLWYCLNPSVLGKVFMRNKASNGKSYLVNFIERYANTSISKNGESRDFVDVYNSTSHYHDKTITKDAYLESLTFKTKYYTQKQFLNSLYILLSADDAHLTSVFNQEELDLIKNNPQCVRVSHIRLNEEGDYIGQWLLDDMNEFAGELKQIGVQMVCYTCRLLDYSSIENILINASKVSLGNKADSKNNINRYFFAVSEDFYNSMGETYGAKDDKGNIIGPTIPTLVTGVDGDNEYGRIIPMPQPLYDSNGQPTGKKYYKCPCGRGKVHKVKGINVGRQPEDDDNSYMNRVARTKLFQSIDTGDVKRKGLNGKKDSEVTPLDAINCYECNVCYSTDSELSNGMIVLVQVHSGNKEDFEALKAMEGNLDRDQAHAQSSPEEIYDADFQKQWSDRYNSMRPELQQFLDNKFANKANKAKNESRIYEETELNTDLPTLDSLLPYKNTRPIAIRQIVRNTEQSIHDKLQNLSSVEKAVNEEKTRFNNLYNKLFGNKL